MNGPGRPPVWLFFITALIGIGLAAACSGVPSQNADQPAEYRDEEEERYGLLAGLEFIPAAFPVPVIDPDAGLITEERPPVPGDEYAQSFRSAYAEALARDIPLIGVLGGDRVHPWPIRDPICRVQNWRSAEDRPNSWGIPGFVLALEHPVLNQVFTVSGIFLDAYGKSAGVDGANGAAGYGCPRGNSFFHEGGMAQRFDLGMMEAGPLGEPVFTPGDTPSSSAAPSSLVGSYDGGDPALRARIADAFRTAWVLGVDRNLPPLDPDGPVARIDFAPRAASYNITGFYIQTFGQASAALILAESAPLPARALLLLPPFLEGLTALPDRIPGSESLSRDQEVPEIAEPLLGALAEGMAFYGAPLTDPLPYGDGSREAQRFSKGWMVRSSD